jgi:bacterioferritin-associated ferredoxin
VSVVPVARQSAPENITWPGIRQIAERTCQISDKIAAESTCQACTRQAQHISERTRAKAAEASMMLRREIEPCQRQPAEAMQQFTLVETGLIVAGKGQPLRSQRRWRQACPGHETLLGTAGNDALKQCFSATEKA